VSLPEVTLEWYRWSLVLQLRLAVGPSTLLLVRVHLVLVDQFVCLLDLAPLQLVVLCQFPVAAVPLVQVVVLKFQALMQVHLVRAEQSVSLLVQLLPVQVVLLQLQLVQPRKVMVEILFFKLVMLVMVLPVISACLLAKVELSLAVLFWFRVVLVPLLVDLCH
jgi:hypothetical protein